MEPKSVRFGIKDMLRETTISTKNRTEDYKKKFDQLTAERREKQKLELIEDILIKAQGAAKDGKWNLEWPIPKGLDKEVIDMVTEQLSELSPVKICDGYLYEAINFSWR